jgi:hypothetical protein
MKERSIFIANDGGIFSDPKRCSLYEALAARLEKTNSSGVDGEQAETLGDALHWMRSSAPGEERLKKMLTLLYLARELFQGVEGANEIFSGAFSHTIRDWREQYGGISKEIANIPGNATREEVSLLLRKHDSNRISNALETMEDSEIPLRIYKLVKEYLA